MDRMGWCEKTREGDIPISYSSIDAWCNLHKVELVANEIDMIPRLSWEYICSKNKYDGVPSPDPYEDSLE